MHCEKLLHSCQMNWSRKQETTSQNKCCAEKKEEDEEFTTLHDLEAFNEKIMNIFMLIQFILQHTNHMDGQ